MDFLDPHKQRAHAIRLIIGYVLIGLAILIATSILLYRAYGFGLDKDGEVVQNGLVFVASQPQDAEIYLDNKKYKDTTGARLELRQGNYALTVRKDGYRPWHRAVMVEGGSVSRYDYPMLVPNELNPVPFKNYESHPGFVTQSPDRRWLLVSQPGNILGFDMFDLRDPEKLAENAKNFSVPEAVVSGLAAEGHAWKLVEWSTDNRHVILQHVFSGGSEYVLVDRDEPARSLNLTTTLQLAPGQELSLRDKKFDRYYIYDPAAQTVATASPAEGVTAVPVLTGVLEYKPYGQNILLYATDVDAPEGKVATMLKDGDVTYKLREIGAGAPYMLELAKYDGDWFAAVGASAENKVFVFKNPQAVRKAGRIENLVPARILRVTAPNFVSFSSNTRFVMIQNATSFAVYDAETDKGYTYATSAPLDTGVEHAIWMDGHRITYVSEGKVVMFDYDNINFQTLVPSAPTALPFYDRDYRYLYTLTPPDANGQSALNVTPMLLEDDR